MGRRTRGAIRYWGGALIVISVVWAVVDFARFVWRQISG